MLPFTADQFFDLFATYNSAVGWVSVAAYGLAAIALWTVWREREQSSQVVTAVLGLLWLWNGVVYHWLYFTSINTAAYGFGALFVVQGVAFFYYGFARGFELKLRRDGRTALGLALIAYAAVIYQVLGFVLGHVWPGTPLFGIAPCPTTIFTFGLLMLSARSLPLWLIAIPVIWSWIGGSAALILQVPADYGLIAAGILGLIFLPFWGYLRAARA